MALSCWIIEKNQFNNSKRWSDKRHLKEDKSSSERLVVEGEWAMCDSFSLNVFSCFTFSKYKEFAFERTIHFYSDWTKPVQEKLRSWIGNASLCSPLGAGSFLEGRGRMCLKMGANCRENFLFKSPSRRALFSCSSAARTDGSGAVSANGGERSSQRFAAGELGSSSNNCRRGAHPTGPWSGPRAPEECWSSFWGNRQSENREGELSHGGQLALRSS